MWLAVCGALALAFAASAPAAPALRVAAVGGFLVGGEPLEVRGLPPRPRLAAGRADPVDPNGDFTRGQTYVHYVRLARPRHRYPILLWHGGSLTGAVFEETPDGRPGWQTDFLRAGFSVYAVDAFQGGRAPFARYPELATEPEFRSKAFAWETFRFGSAGSFATRRAYPGTLFPTEAFDVFAKGLTPRFAIDPARDEATYRAVLERACPCVLITHSASGPLGFALAARHPDLIRGLVSVEPSGGGPPTSDALSKRPHMVLWGDYLDLGNPDGDWAQLHGQARRYADQLEAQGARVTWVELPKAGVTGNSHMLMSDRNSRDIALRISAWITANVR